MPGERSFIESLRSRAAMRTPALRLGIGDDCAVLRPPAGHDIHVTTDFSLEGRHFRRDWHTAASAGHRCLARGLSDLAAMGASPLAAFLSLALPAGFSSSATNRRWLDGFLDGLLALADSMRTPLAGGDTAASPSAAILADIVLVGSAPRNRHLRRSGARPGDLLYVTGTPGASAAELRALAQNPRRYRRAAPVEPHPHLFPQPRLAAGRRLRGLATAAIDVSDGLSTDLHHLCDESRVGADLHADALPQLPGIPPEQALDLALHGGEDYELLFTAAPATRIPRSIAGVPVTRIGTITRGRTLTLRTGSAKRPLPNRGWEHPL